MIRADFSGTCEGCGHVIAEPGAKGAELWRRCFAPGPRRGYVVSDRNGRVLPYVPAWCPMRGKVEKDGSAG